MSVPRRFGLADAPPFTPAKEARIREIAGDAARRACLTPEDICDLAYRSAEPGGFDAAFERVMLRKGATQAQIRLLLAEAKAAAERGDARA